MWPMGLLLVGEGEGEGEARCIFSFPGEFEEVSFMI